jgi:hypothetical protein
MELYILELNLASRWLLIRLLNQCPDHTPVDDRTIRDVRKRFELKEAQKEHKKLVRQRNLEIWEAQKKLDEEEENFNKARERGEKYEINQDIEIPDGIDWDDLIETRAKSYTIDDSYIAWLKTQFDPAKAQWEKLKRLDSNGKLIVDDMLVTAAMREAIADLSDAIYNAKPVRENQGEASRMKEIENN